MSEHERCMNPECDRPAEIAVTVFGAFAGRTCSTCAKGALLPATVWVVQDDTWAGEGQLLTVYSSREAAELWALSEGISETLARTGLPHKNDVALPIAALAPFCAELEQFFAARYPGWELFIFGHIGDRHGRRIALMISVLLMCLGSLLIACAPTYAVAGIWSPAILLLARLLQGLSLGGEYGASATYLSEMA
mgnify:CR=1 FL=1